MKQRFIVVSLPPDHDEDLTNLSTMFHAEVEGGARLLFPLPPYMHTLLEEYESSLPQSQKENIDAMGS
jgi:hypothetical protein